MGSNPINLLVRLLLELVAYLAMGYWGWKQADGPFRFVSAVGVPLMAAFLWGTFAVPDDPSRSGKAPVPVPGILRLALELAFFAFGAWALLRVGAVALGWILVILTSVHYLASYDRVRWLIKHENITSKG